MNFCARVTRQYAYSSVARGLINKSCYCASRTASLNKQLFAAQPKRVRLNGRVRLFRIASTDIASGRTAIIMHC